MTPAPFEATAAQLTTGFASIAVRGELDLSTAPELEGPLDEAVASGDAAVLIDLSECEFIDSTGIALIVRAWQQLDRGADGDGSGRVVDLQLQRPGAAGARDHRPRALDPDSRQPRRSASPRCAA